MDLTAGTAYIGALLIHKYTSNLLICPQLLTNTKEK